MNVHLPCLFLLVSLNGICFEPPEQIASGPNSAVLRMTFPRRPSEGWLFSNLPLGMAHRTNARLSADDMKNVQTPVRPGRPSAEISCLRCRGNDTIIIL